MRKIQTAHDMNGRPLAKGDTVTDRTSQITGRICDLASEDGAYFVRLRPLHQPYAQGVWYAADRVLFLSAARKRGSSTSKA